VLDWPTDGVPTVRPNLGTTFIPALFGQDYHLSDGQMPWPGEPLTAEEIRAGREMALERAPIMRLATEFYQAHAEQSPPGVFAYQPDNQGVFDIAHLLIGDQIFYDIMDENRLPEVEELLSVCLDEMLDEVRYCKELTGEPGQAMIHGHGTPQGSRFVAAGIRLAEDTATLISPMMIDRLVLPTIERAAGPFGGAFVHFCGKHQPLLERLCRMPCVRAVDLGNPEMYDTRGLMETCAEHDTVLYSRLPSRPDESPLAYVDRLAEQVRATGARVFLRATAVPRNRDEAAAMLDHWHERTEP
jgi:hypothetical protein